MFSDVLSGSNAFYAQENYEETTRDEFAQKEALPTVSYRYEIDSKVKRIAKFIFSVIVFPVGLYNLIHGLAGKLAIVLAATPATLGYRDGHADTSRQDVLNGSNEGWKYKRLTIEVDGYKIDAVIMGKPSTLNNGKWVLASNGNGEFYEDKLQAPDFKHIVAGLNANALVFNYPGVAASTGTLPTREALSKAYRAMLSFLEDQEKGIGAKEIIGFGHSLGGGVQGDALQKHSLQEDIKYLFVKGRTFSNLAQEVTALMGRPFGFLIKVFGWNIDSVASSKSLQVPEIILQTAANVPYGSYNENLNNSQDILSDGVIPAEASLAKALLDDHDCPKDNKLFVGIRERHNDELHPHLRNFLIQAINERLQ